MIKELTNLREMCRNMFFIRDAFELQVIDDDDGFYFEDFKVSKRVGNDE